MVGLWGERDLKQGYRFVWCALNIKAKQVLERWAREKKKDKMKIWKWKDKVKKKKRMKVEHSDRESASSASLMYT